MQGKGSGTTALQPELLSKESAFNAMIFGRRFSTTSQAIVTGQTVLAATTPTFMIRNPSTGTRRVILRSISLTSVDRQGLRADIHVVLDTADRFSAGGSAITPSNMNGESSVASLVSFLVNPTATAPGAGTRNIISTAIDTNANAVPSMIFFKDGLLIPHPGSLLVYTVRTPQAPEWRFAFEWEEIA